MAVLPHAFVVMPFGRKPGGDGVPINFNLIYADLILPALRKAGLEPFRADEEQHAGNINHDMFQELLLADLVVADLTIDNPSVWYQLGVRHALSARGVVLICGGKVPTAFDLQPERKLRYGLLDGVPDSTTLPSDIKNLADMVRATMESWQGRRISPVYALLPNLQEPDWRSLSGPAVQTTSAPCLCSPMRAQWPLSVPRPGLLPAQLCARQSDSGSP